MATLGDRRKQQALRELLDVGLVGVHLDARGADVDVPAHLKDKAALRLNLSWRFSSSSSFEFSDDTIVVNLSFGGAWHRCVVPWRAIFALTSQSRRLLFIESVPIEWARPGLEAPPPIIQELEPEVEGVEPEPTQPRTSLRLVEEDP